MALQVSLLMYLWTVSLSLEKVLLKYGRASDKCSTAWWGGCVLWGCGRWVGIAYIIEMVLMLLDLSEFFLISWAVFLRRMWKQNYDQTHCLIFEYMYFEKMISIALDCDVRMHIWTWLCVHDYGKHIHPCLPCHLGSVIRRKSLILGE